MYTFGKCWKKSLKESLPFIDLKINWALNDLLLPGFPIINKGILVFKQTNIENKFSNKALFLAIPFSRSTESAIIFCIIFGKSSKSNFFPKDSFINSQNPFLIVLSKILI